MPSDNKQLTITIGATLSAAFNSVISGSTSKLNQVSTVIKGLEKYGENHSVILHIPY